MGREIMMYFKVLFNNTSVVSNFLQFDKDGKIIGLSTNDDDMIHMYNKADVISRHVSYNSDKSSQRKNVILMGDSLGDLDMAVKAGSTHEGTSRVSLAGVLA